MAAHLTDEDKQYILKRHQDGAPLRQIGREIRRPDITVRRTLEAAGVSFGPPRTVNQRSSPETEAHVLRLYDQGLTWAEINCQADVTSLTVSRILQRNGRDFDRKNEGTEGETDLILALYETGHSARDIGRMLGHSKSTICNVITTASTDGMRKPRGCEYPDFFEQINTPERAYWLGFISADGCIIATTGSPDGARIALKLGIRDAGHLVKLKETLGASTGVHTGVQRGTGKTHGYAAFAVSSPRLVQGLLALGVTRRKSATLEPWDGPADLMSHYWRGMVDGDGSLARKGGGLYTVFLCGSEPAVRAFAEWASGVCGTKATPYFRTGCWYISISGRFQVPKLVRALYGDAPVSLDRKQEIADRILEAAEL